LHPELREKVYCQIWERTEPGPSTKYVMNISEVNKKSNSVKINEEREKQCIYSKKGSKEKGGNEEK
jgi:hypothetical protein